MRARMVRGGCRVREMARCPTTAAEVTARSRGPRTISSTYRRAAKTARRSHARTPSSARTAADLVASTRVVAGALVRTNLDTLRDVIANKTPGAGSTLGNVDRRFFSHEGPPSDDANRSNEAPMVRGSVRRADVRHSHARATHELPIQTSTPRKTTTMRSPILLLLLGVLLALTPGAEAGKLGKLLWWKHWGKHGHGHRSGSGWWASPATKSDAKGMDHGDMMKMHGDMDMSHMDDDADDDDSQDWWRSKSWRTESWWGKHMSRHGGWKMRSSGRAFGSGQGIRAAKCMVRECGMELQKCRMDMTCRQGVKCAVGEDSSSPSLSGFPSAFP